MNGYLNPGAPDNNPPAMGVDTLENNYDPESRERKLLHILMPGLKTIDLKIFQIDA